MKKLGRPRGTKSKWNRKLPFEERFWEKVNKLSDDECWEWMAFVHPTGYGMFSVNRKMTSAQRVAWTLTYGEIPEGKLVCHHCDNRACCNPKHLFLGTYKDNARDMVNKRREQYPDNRGERHGLSKLTTNDVLKIRDLYSSGDYTQQEIANRFRINRKTVSKIVLRQRWSWLK